MDRLRADLRNVIERTLQPVPRDLVVSAQDSALIGYCSVTKDEDPPRVTRADLTERLRWKPYMTIDKDLTPRARQAIIKNLPRGLEWLMFSFAMHSAVHRAALLVQQLGGQTKAPDSHWKFDAACRDAVAHYRRLNDLAAFGVALIMAKMPEAGGRSKALLHVRRSQEAVAAVTEDGQTLWQASWRDFVKDIVDAWARAVGGVVESLKRFGQCWVGREPELSRALHEPVRDAFEHARETGQVAGCRFWRGFMDGFPAEVHLYVAPGRPADEHGDEVPFHRLDGAPGPDDLPFRRFTRELRRQSACGGLELARRVVLTLRRGHEDFVLSNKQGELFYFPPVQLEARLSFLANGEWELGTPRVYQPAGQPVFVHPYTGRLAESLLAASAHMVDGELAPAVEPMRAPVWLREAVQNHEKAASGVMCLNGQDATLQALRSDLREKGDRDDFDLLGLLRQCIEMLRAGLLYGHQENDATPIAEMVRPAMPYYLTAPLAGVKTIPYHPRDLPRLNRAAASA